VSHRRLVPNYPRIKVEFPRHELEIVSLHVHYSLIFSSEETEKHVSNPLLFTGEIEKDHVTVN
jgi:hypothetical protein